MDVYILSLFQIVSRFFDFFDTSILLCIYILSPSIYLNHLSNFFSNYLHHLEATGCNYGYVLYARWPFIGCMHLHAGPRPSWMLLGCMQACTLIRLIGS